MSRPQRAVMPLSSRALDRMKLAFLLAVAGQVPHLPIWTTIMAFLLLAWRHYLDRRRRRPLPPPGVRLALALGACVVVYLQFGFFMGRDPGVSALVVLAAVKLLEVRQSRDFHLMGYLCYFLTAALFLFTQELPALLFGVVQLLAVNAAFLQLYAGRSGSLRPLRGASGMLLASVPVAVVLFILFPRYPGPLWGLGGAAGESGVSGFSDTLQPGSVARMVESQRAVMRMKVAEAELPPPRQRYFRGLVLWLTDGRTWYPGRIGENIAGSTRRGRDGVKQEIMLEPHGQRWLFALDYPVRVPPGSLVSPGNVFRYHRRVERPIRYRVDSRIGGIIPEPDLHPYLRRMALQLPREVNPGLRTLVEPWLREGTDARALAERVLEFFRSAGFTYSLQPGNLDPRDPVGDFLLNTRRGFCGHYAAGFALLMRLGEVPCRIVAGYQGGETNPVDGQLVVRDADAHAWTEIWLDGRGWLRVDPTAAVVPERLEYGGRLNASLDEMAAGTAEDRSSVLRRAMTEGGLARAWRWIRDYWDVARNYWQTWVVRYDRYQQRSLLSRLGVRGIQRAGKLALVMLFVVFTWRLTRWLFRLPAQRRRDPLEKSWRLLEARLSRGGMNVESWQGPLDISRQARRRFPNQADAIDQVIQTYIRLRYGVSFAAGVEKSLLRRVRKLRIPRRWKA
ncbi:MAG TPA: DUF3488 domain-containing protein [Candidatus Aminicenantes bacterium]|nr:DUF3488 domain-containing protein [Candidatus Aminicenantes bacterium]